MACYLVPAPAVRLMKIRVQSRPGVTRESIFYKLAWSLRISEVHLFYNLLNFYWHFLEILWLFIFLFLYSLSSCPARRYKIIIERYVRDRMMRCVKEIKEKYPRPKNTQHKLAKGRKDKIRICQFVLCVLVRRGCLFNFS